MVGNSNRARSATGGLTRLILMLVLLISGPASLHGEALSLGKSFSQPRFLPVDEAFLLEVTREEGKVRIHWLIKPGYYLYKDRLSFNLTNSPVLPDGIEKNDEIFGQVEVYYTELTVSVPNSEDFVEDEVEFVVGYQGCADAGLCYPPQTRAFKLDKI